MGRQEGLGRAAQERGVMARHRSDDQKFRLVLGARMIPFERDDAAEGTLPDDFLGDRHLLVADHGGRQVEGGLAVAPRGALEQFAGRRDGPAIGRVREGIAGIIEQVLREIGSCASRTQKPMRGIVPNIRKIHLYPQRPGAWFSHIAVGFILNRNFKIKVPSDYCNSLALPLQKRTTYFGFRASLKSTIGK